jgi:hypothetical protein
MGTVGQQAAAHEASLMRLHSDYIVQQNMMNRQLMSMPARAALAQVVEELVKSPPTDEELRTLTDMGVASEALVVKKVQAQVTGSRIVHFIQMLMAKSNLSVADCIMILLMLYQIYLMENPPQPPPPPTPEVTVNVTVHPTEPSQKDHKGHR